MNYNKFPYTYGPVPIIGMDESDFGTNLILKS
jgi:hypothetical protein